MPKDLPRLEGKVYCHVYNIGVEKRIIFADPEDYDVFLDYLEGYLTAPADPESTKKVFTVHGRTFRGSPHQPKNYFNKIELIAYSLTPNHFHLLLHQREKGSLESFLRSLFTRYSMYFNKKYDRTGSLFEGPYKSIEISDPTQLGLLTLYIHSHGSNKYSSLPEYSGRRETPWVNTKDVLSVQKLISGQTESDLSEGITLEKNTPLERRNLAPNIASIPEKRSRKFEILTSFAIFLVLFGTGLRNINVTKASTVLSESTQVESTPEPTALPTPMPLPKTMVQIRITDGQEAVNIRQNPTTSSEKIGQAKEGETFEFVSLNSGWYEVRLSDGSIGFISERYISVVEETTNE